MSSEWINRLNNIGEATNNSPNEETSYVPFDEQSTTPLTNPKRTKEEFLANPPHSFQYERSVGTMHMTLIGQNDDLIQYHGLLYQAGEPNFKYGYVVYVFKRMCSRLKGFVQAYNLETNEQIITDYSGFADKAVRKLKCDWARWAFKQFGFTPYEDTV
jgi:hypothetical protein